MLPNEMSKTRYKIEAGQRWVPTVRTNAEARRVLYVGNHPPFMKEPMRYDVVVYTYDNGEFRYPEAKCDGHISVLRFGHWITKFAAIVEGAGQPATIKPFNDIMTPTYHDLYITTPSMERVRMMELPFKTEVTCNRIGGWQLWALHADNTSELLGGEFEGDERWLKLDVKGFVICDGSKN